jgi:hypothetical protein
VLRHFVHVVRTIIDIAVAIPAGVTPRRHWPGLDRYIPVSRTAALSAIATIGLAAWIGIPGYLRHAEANAATAVDLMLSATGWRTPRQEGPAATVAAAQLTWAASYLSLLTFLTATPAGWLTLYLGGTGLLRTLSAVVEDPHGDPVLTVIDRIVNRRLNAAAARRARQAREQLEGPVVPDLLVTGRAAGIPDADFVVVASRAKQAWDRGTIIITSEKWFRVGTVVERQMPTGLRTLYPLTEKHDHEAVRRSVRYELPRLAGSGFP